MNDTAFKLGLIVVYLLVMAAIGVRTYQRTGRDPVSYFLANRNLGTLVLAFTMLATLMSSFTVMGVPADAYTHGLGIFLGVGLTDAMLATLFFALGYRLWLAAHAFDLVTPSEFFAHRFGSPLLGALYAISALFFTAPYISIQIIGGGYALESFTNGAVPYLPAAIVIAIVITGYVLLGGMRAVAWTDTVQSIIMLLGMLTAFVIIAAVFMDGELLAARGRDWEEWLRLPGPTGRWSWQGLVGYQWLIFMGVPLFPQVFQRFYTARDLDVFKRAMTFWPLLVLILFFPGVLIGVWGRAVFPDLDTADRIMPLMITEYLPGWVAALVITAVLAALMSTADSQLLTCSSLFTRDIYARYIRPAATHHDQGRMGRWFVVAISVLSFAIAVNPPDVIIEIATWSFQGSAMLFPVLIAGLYWPRCTRAGAEAGAIVSSALTVGWLTGILPRAWTFGWIPVIPAVVAGTVVLVVVSLLTQPDRERTALYFQRLWRLDG